MDDDGQSSSLFGNYTWWQLGHWSAENAQQEQAAVAKLTGRAPVPIRDYNHALHVLGQWRAECHRLQQANAQLQAQLNAANAHQAELKAWADKVLADRDRWKAKAEEKGRQTFLMSERANRLQDELESFKGSA